MSTEIMAPRKNRCSKASTAIAKAIINEYQPQTIEEMQAALKDIFGPMFESMLQGEMDSHLGYESNDHGYKNTDNCRNGYVTRLLRRSMATFRWKFQETGMSLFNVKLHSQYISLH